MASSPDNGEEMRLVPQDKPSEPLIYSMAPSPFDKDLPAELGQARLKGSGFLWNNTTAWIGGILFALAVVILGSLYVVDQRQKRAAERSLAAMSTVTTEPAGAPAVRVNIDKLYVSAISLGDTKLAVVNGASLAEGDYLQVETEYGSARLQVLKITDGAVEFTNGPATIVAELRRSPTEKKNP